MLNINWIDNTEENLRTAYKDYDNLAKKPTNFSRGMNCLIIFL